MPPSDKAPNWMTVSALAERLGVSKQSLSERVCRMEERQQLQTRRQGREKLVDADEFDRVSARTQDGVRALNGSTIKRRQQQPPPVKPARSTSRQPLESNTLVHEQARRANISADLLDLRLQEQLGRLLPVRDVEAAMCRCAEAMVRRINEVPTRADELAAAVAQEGAIGARRKLKEIGFDLRQALAAEMRALAAEGKPAPEAARQLPQPTSPGAHVNV